MARVRNILEDGVLEDMLSRGFTQASLPRHAQADAAE